MTSANYALRCEKLSSVCSSLTDVAGNLVFAFNKKISLQNSFDIVAPLGVYAVKRPFVPLTDAGWTGQLDVTTAWGAGLKNLDHATTALLNNGLPDTAYSSSLVIQGGTAALLVDGYTPAQWLASSWIIYFEPIRNF